MEIKSYIQGNWTSGDQQGSPLYNAVTGALIGHAGTGGFNFADILQYGRDKGGTALRKMTFYERGLMLKALALHLHDLRKKYYPISYMTGATKTDSWIDIEGGIGNLFANASLRKKLGSNTFVVEGETIGLSKGGTFIGQHILVPKKGVAVHINAFNFPIWGMLEKIAVNLLAGVPAIVKPATITCFLTQVIVEDIIASKILPEGALQLICGSARDILDHVNNQDIVTFTGSATTGRKLKTHPAIIEHSVPFNMEADSLNCAVLGEDAVLGTEEFDIFIKEVRKEMTVKCGQKCTAIRRIIVPEDLVQNVIEALSKQLDKTIIGDPQEEGVRMGSLVGVDQVAEVKERVAELALTADIVYGSLNPVHPKGAESIPDAFFSPILLHEKSPLTNTACHEVEAFGPVSTVMPYKTIEEAVTLANMGKGSLVSSIVTNDPKIAQQYVLEAACFHGRILILNRHSAQESTGHGSPLPMLVHGGPGRAGGGEEMGGINGVKHYLQRTALQGSPNMITAVTNHFQPGADYELSGPHPFRKHFEDLKVGDTVITHKRTITEADIVNFANVSWDHFYAHTDTTSLDGTIFEERVAHGYFILSAAAGLFVDPGKGPVLLNYGIEECRFTKPVYAGATIGVRLTVKEKVDQEKREDEDVEKGIVKFLVDVYDEMDETIAVATILTMVKKKENSY